MDEAGAMQLSHDELVAFLASVHARPRGTGAILNLIRGAKTRTAADVSLLSELVADPEIKLELARHAADETRHACRLLERMTELGFRAFRVPVPLDRTEGFFDRTRARDVRQVHAHRGVVGEAELMELVVAAYVAKKERLRMLDATHDALAAADPTRALLQEIVTDERRHVAFLARWLGRFETRFSRRAVARACERLEAVLAQLDVAFHAALQEYLARAAA
jgi:hypothetical protein